MYFDEVEKSPMKQSVRNTDVISLLLKEALNDMIDKNYESTYNLLSNESKAKFNNSAEEFGKFIYKEYIRELSIIRVEYSGYDSEEDIYLYDVYISGPPDQTKLSEEEKDLYKQKFKCLKLNIDYNNDFVINW